MWLSFQGGIDFLVGTAIISMVVDFLCFKIYLKLPENIREYMLFYEVILIITK